MVRRTVWSVIAGWVLIGAGWASAQTSLIPPPGYVKVAVEFRQAGQTSQSGTVVQGTGAGGTIVQIDRRRVTGSGQVQIQDTRQGFRRSTGAFILVMDGGEGQIAVTEQVANVAWFYQYALGRNHITQGVVFRQVGTSLLVRPTILPNRHIRLRVVPQLAYRSDRGDGTIELVEAATNVVVPSGLPITIGGGASGEEVMRQFLLGYEQAQRTSDVTIVLTAETP